MTVTSSFFAFLRRMKWIQRWGLMRNVETENIQEHSLEVAWIAHALGNLHNTYFEGHIDANRLAVLAMYHEVSEIFTGDLPTPIKYFDPSLRKLYGELEEKAQRKMLGTLPAPLRPAYEECLLGTQDEMYRRFLKAADTLAAYLKCITERKADNDEFNEAFHSIRQKLNDMKMPEVDLFLQTFVPSLSESLDKLHYYLDDNNE